MAYQGVIAGVGRTVGSGPNPLEDSSRDGPSQIRVPTTSPEFSMLNAPTPDYLWLCQETSGNLATSIGSLTLTSNGAGTHLYQQSITGWTRKAVGSQDDNTVCAWRVNTGPLAGEQSVAWFGLFRFPSSVVASSRPFLAACQGGAGTQLTAQFTTTGTITMDNAGLDVPGSYNYVDGLVHPVVLTINRTALTVNLYTDRERLTGVYNSNVGNGTQKGLGGTTGGVTVIYRCLWLAAYAGTNAERNWRDILATSGWSPPY